MRLRKCVAGISVAAALLAGGFAPTAVADDEVIPPSALSEAMSSNDDESMDIATAINRMAGETGDGAAAEMKPAGETQNTPDNGSSDTATGQPDSDGEASADGGTTSRSVFEASKASDTAKDQLNAVIEATADDNLTPLASGYRADDSGTAPYDSWKANPDDLKALHEARQAAQAVADSSDASEEQITQAAQDLQAAFDAVRFIYHYTGITGTNGMRLYDNNGNLIQAHGAGIIRAKTETLGEADQKLDENGDGIVYIWCGEDKTDRLVAHGVRIYYSDDLLNWVDKGRGFQTFLGKEDLEAKMSGEDPVYQQYYNVENMKSDPDYTNIYGEDFQAFADDSSNNNIDSAEKALDVLLWDLKALKGDGENPTDTSCVFERPKMVYNEATKRWVIWFHADGPRYGYNEWDATYAKAKGGVAISTTSDPAGPYKYLGSFRLNTGDNSGNPGMLRDMNLYVDDKDANNDGVKDAYLIYASDENTDMTISLLDKTYTKLAKPISQEQRGTSVENGDTYNTVSWDSRESPAPVKWNGRYYIIYSHTTGWRPNQNEYMVSEGDNILGPYSNGGCPFVEGDGPNQSPSDSFYTQSSSVIPVDESKGLYIYWGDRWFNPDTGNDISQSRYVMTPIQFVGDQLRVLPHGDWTLDDLDRYEVVQLDESNDLPSTAGSMSDLMASLPSTVTVVRGANNGGADTETLTTAVSWDPYFGDDQPTGDVTVTGHLPELNDVTVSFTVTVYPKDTVLYIDAGSDPGNESDYYRNIVENASGLINNKASDQPYSVESGWGYVGTVGADGDMQRYGTESSDVYETGWYANAGKTIAYKADLKAGTYSVTAGFKDWWAEWNKRWVDFAVSGEDGGELGRVESYTGDGTESEPITFTLDADQTVTFTVYGKSGQDVGSGQWKDLDPVLSWISVVSVDDDRVVSVDAVEGVNAYLLDGAADEPHTGDLPSEVTVQLANGTSEQRAVTWDLSDADAGQPYVLTDVRGTVEGTTLPASMTVQMMPNAIHEYFIDVNSADSGTWKRLGELMANRGSGDQHPGNRLLLNALKADQPADSLWGNSTETSYAGYSGGNADDPYSTGIYANENEDSRKVLSYDMTLPEGTHQIMVGFHDWWNQNRPTQVYYSIDGGEETELAYANVDGRNSTASGTLTVPEGNHTVRVAIRSTTGTGPILSWLSASLVKEAEPSDPVATSVEPVTAQVKAGQVPTLPETVTVNYSDNSTRKLSVMWNLDAVDWTSCKSGDKVTVNGAIEGVDSLAATATVTVVDPDVPVEPQNEAPVFAGVGDVTVVQGEKFDPMAGVSATDKEDGDVSERITVSGTVDVNAVGEYTVTYQVTDSQGATSTVVRTVTVKAKEQPENPDGPGSSGTQPGQGDGRPAADANQVDNVPATGSSVFAIAMAAALLAVAAGVTAVLRRKRKRD